MTNAVDAMLMKFLAVFGEPQSADPETLFNEHRRILGRYGPDVIAAATDAMIEKFAFWPRPAEAKRIASEIQDDAARTARTRSQIAAQFTERQALGEGRPSAEERARVRALVDETVRQFTDAEQRGSSVSFPDRPTFEAMQARSANRVHRRPEADQ